MARWRKTLKDLWQWAEKGRHILVVHLQSFWHRVMWCEVILLMQPPLYNAQRINRLKFFAECSWVALQCGKTGRAKLVLPRPHLTPRQSPPISAERATLQRVITALIFATEETRVWIHCHICRRVAKTPNCSCKYTVVINYRFVKPWARLCKVCKILFNIFSAAKFSLRQLTLVCTGLLKCKSPSCFDISASYAS